MNCRMMPVLFATLTPVFATAEPMHVTARSRTNTGVVIEKTVAIEPRQTAIVICDMWDKHWCASATRRVGEMAPRMNDVISLARSRGVLIIHAPSDCMDFYKDTPQRKLAMSAPEAKDLPKDIDGGCRRLADEPALPIDDSDGGCDDAPPVRNYRAWQRQIDAIKIAENDAVSASGREIWNLLESKGIQNVVLMGVHTNMCVVGRPFGLRQMAKNGKTVFLCRDLTDAMYNPRKAPYVSHARGTELVIGHIEQHICPSILADDLCGDAKRPHVVFVVGEDEYKTEVTLPKFAREDLEKRGFKCTFVFADAKDKNSFPDIGKLKEADLLVLSVRRRVPPEEQLKVVRDYLEAGKPMVGIRTSSHAFSLRDKPDGWPAFDKDVLGGSYNMHYDNAPGKGEATVVFAVPESKKHPILTGVPAEFTSKAHLYRNKTLARSATPLLRGRIGEKGTENEFVAWTNTYKGARIFYTSLGYVEDFQEPAFRKLLLNGIYWALERAVPEK